MAKTSRVYRVGEKIQSLIANQLFTLSDPRFYLVTITAVRMSKDLRYARVYWLATGGKQRVAEVEMAFLSAAGHIRACIAKDLGARVAPELKFFYDNTLDAQQEAFDLIDKVIVPQEKKERVSGE
jgi:ribosome-binding factor A